MQLPGAQHGVVTPFKVRDYLLSFEHPTGRSKAEFFSRLGFARARGTKLYRALLEHARTGEGTALPSGPFGQKYLVRGIIEGPTGRIASVVSVWVILAGATFPRLVTAYRGDSV